MLKICAAALLATLCCAGAANAHGGGGAEPRRQDAVEQHAGDRHEGRPQHPLAVAGDKPVSPFDLVDYPLVVPGVGTAPRHDVEGFFAAHGVALPTGRTETRRPGSGSIR